MYTIAFYVYFFLFYRQSVVAIVTLVPLLGLTWVFGLLIVNQQSTVFAWLFTFFSCFQVNEYQNW